MNFRDFLRSVRTDFPQLTIANSRPTSPFDDSYNCIAWAAEDADNWWWPDVMGQNYWPTGVPREESLDAFIRAFGFQGYIVCVDASLEMGREKIAIYTTSNGKPTHASRQLLDGWWVSKLGQQIDIEHEYGALDGPVYGTVAVILSRPKK